MTDKVSRQCKMLLYALVSTLVFEGLIRKLLPSVFGIALFFLKDLLCLAGLYILLNKKFRGNAGKMQNMWKTLFALFIPLIVYTGFFDVTLSVFGPKQYMLFIVTALLVPAAFPANKVQEFKKFCAFLAFLLVPTTLVAVLQNALPSTHWLNQGIGGSDLGNFGAAGYLRVSSTFSFTGQFSWFLNSVCVFFMIRFFMPPFYSSKLLRIFEKVMPFLLGLMLVVGAFVTGGRTAVIGCATCLALGFLISGFKRPEWLFSKGILAVFFLAFSLSVLSAAKPELFAAYFARSQGTAEKSHNEEVEERMLDGLVGWTEWFDKQELSAVLFGNGLGVMSNGSDQISSYAREIRSTGFWTEGDTSSTLWEGGLYLGLIWYGFRLTVIFLCINMWRSLKNTSYVLASSFLLSYIIIMGVFAAFGIQPPVSIWFFLCVGAMITIKNFDSHKQEIVPKHSINLKMSIN